MFLLYVLLVTTASVLGSTDLDDVCPLDSCTLVDKETEFSAKLALEIDTLILRSWGDLKVLELTPNLEYLGLSECSSNISLEAATPRVISEDWRFGIAIFRSYAMISSASFRA